MSSRVPRCGCLVVGVRGSCRGFGCGRGGSGRVGLSDGRGWKKMSVVFHQVATHWVGKLGFSVRLGAAGRDQRLCGVQGGRSERGGKEGWNGR